MTKSLKILSFIDCVLHGGGWVLVVGTGGAEDFFRRVPYIMFGTEKRGDGKKFLNAKS